MKNLTILFSLFLISNTLMLGPPAHAGNSEADLRNEISFLAKKLLDKSGQKELTIEQPSIQKPFLGICGEPGHNGVLLNCVTPGHNAYKAGLQTGDMITSINGVSMLGQRLNDHNSMNVYYKMMAKMKTGDVLQLVLLRHGKEVKQQVTVGAFKQPSYTLVIRRN